MTKTSILFGVELWPSPFGGLENDFNIELSAYCTFIHEYSTDKSFFAEIILNSYHSKSQSKPNIFQSPSVDKKINENKRERERDGEGERDKEFN